jgi:hypothetical protein
MTPASRVVAIAAAIAIAACSTDPTAGTNTGEAIIALGDELNAVREESSLLQAQIDSLRTVVARQDSVLRVLANLAGVQIRE